ncbi:permease for cytosine/purines, uracil, thiamine, allantoin-domain-containing protein [Lentinula lateritia]|uniref:Permease for cytosine/purines, uracil, thiamine, allantoin-domain-containing protein n=1 Tax=Lentinula lateritia TaxID=40482 RepID=A0ABQ8V5P5_9AGAR|nr:permease for cytosine/purines, uracil, thiamine, allantoin-domain-containing protein [Lentinula lateritia]
MSAEDSEKAYSSSAGDDVPEYAGERAVNKKAAERFGVFAPVMEKLFDYGVEARGVERVLENERDPKLLWNNLFMWWSVNCVLTTVPIGALAQAFFTLSFGNACATILCFGALGAAFTSGIATLGPKTGLRTMIIARFSSGYIGGIIYSIFNILTQLGFATTCVILGGQTLAAVRPDTLSLEGGVAIVAVLSVIPCFVGYELLHRYERYVWAPILLVMLFLWGLGGKAGYHVTAQKAFEDPAGRFLAGDVLSFGGIVFGSFTGWAPVAADYNCKLPVNTSAWAVFFMTFFGLYLPVCFISILGAALMTITNPVYVAAYEDGSMGGLIAQVLTPWGGFGKFLLVVLALSVIANNMVNTYSTGISIQALGRPFAVVPRMFWTLVGFIAYTIAGIVGREHFSDILSNFLSILSYWTAFFMVITLEEHFIFRRKGGPLGGYNLDDWDTPSKLPLGIAGILAGAIGVAGAVVGMAEVWYIGPIGILAGNPEFGGDLGFELAAIFAGVSYPFLRWLEIRLVGR